MNPLPIPIRTDRAGRGLPTSDPARERIERLLLSSIDGHRNLIELESFARAMGLDPGALDRLRGNGLIELP
jgi:hypothetical protein